MKGQIGRQGNEERPQMAEEAEGAPQETRHDAQREIQRPTALGSYRHDERALSRATVVVDVAIVVHHQQRVDNQTTRQSSHKALPRNGLPPDGQGKKIGQADGHEAEEEQHQKVAHADIGEVGGIEEAEDHTQRSDGHHRPTAEEDEREPYGASQQRGEANGEAHGAGRHPPLCTSPLGAQSLLVVGAFLEIEIVVHEVGVNLHDEGKEQAEDGCRPRDVARGVGNGKRGSNHHGNGRPRERLGACGKKPSARRVLLFNVHSSFFLKPLQN